MTKCFAAFLGAVMALAAGPALAEPVTLKLSFFSNDTEVNYAKVIKPWVDAVNADPSGAVKIDAYPNGALGKSLPAQPQLVLDGVADIAFINPSLVPGRFPDDQVFELPGLLKDLGEGTKLYAELVKSNSLRGYGDYHVIGSFMNANYNLYSRRPIRSNADLKGMKVRIVGPIVGQTVKELGMVPVLMPPNEIVEAIGRGTVDAATLVPAAVIDFGVDRVTSHSYLLDLGAGPLGVVMNRARYEALPAEAKAVLDKYSGAWINDLYVKALLAHNAEIIARFKADAKRTVVMPSAADLAAIKAPYEKVTAAWAAKDPNNAKVLAKAREILTQIRAK
ncbi:TRAP transporter substrate-binding protein DctP [Rhodoplanes sp. TEM]|uniref:TRAP transporter substrate-binding protein DctP n=1 Tax=Rhodoplanes tepidamans TaxID=200616 RepID=A0ABT5J5W2_RHOTP|nr:MULTISPECIES: TRAP transporter substrate-binding protein DctP [Rhodoplanes]MDC7785024.1 TRAP transporter substrate-binding protein DctP [Rhodoplanes tepidamans]MDC7982498.1 TRAP transporter substrate-binding protein DctP [Rhodoplanes sp. TEM]MDQ0356512.1 TRAP-type C4-dicarboxylate transport system substrate-binding protein [Rhodoplanes tepidamans]